MQAFIMNNVWLVMLALASGVWLMWSFIQQLGVGAETIPASRVTQLINQESVIVVDVREQNEFSSGHLPQAKHLPLSGLEKTAADFVKQHAGKGLVVYCQSGARAMNACKTLKKAGAGELFLLKDGIYGWLEANLPLQKKR